MQALKNAIDRTIAEQYLHDLWYVTYGWLVFTQAREVLDVDSASGFFCQALAKSGWRTTSVGADAAELMRRQTSYGSAGLAGRFELSAPETLPFAEGSFERVISINGLEFAADEGLALSEIRRVLRPGGLAVVAVLNRLGPWSLPPAARQLRPGSDLRRAFTKTSLHQTLGKSGFEVIGFKDRARFLPIPIWPQKRTPSPLPGCLMALVRKPK